MNVREMCLEDIKLVLPLYIDYYNNQEEIILAYEYQNQGIGSQFLVEVERRVKELGAACVELQAVNDEMHERYYGKAGYHDAQNFVMKVKWFE